MLSIDTQFAGFVAIRIHHFFIALAFTLRRPLSAFSLSIAAGQTDATFLGTSGDQVAITADAVSRADSGAGESAKSIVSAFRPFLRVGIESG